MTINIDVRGLPHETLLIIADRACCRLCNIANYLTSDEGDEEETEAEFGLDASEVIEMAHDNMIEEARGTIKSIAAEIAAVRTKASQTPPDGHGEGRRERSERGRPNSKTPSPPFNKEG